MGNKFLTKLFATEIAPIHKVFIEQQNKLSRKSFGIAISLL